MGDWKETLEKLSKTPLSIPQPTLPSIDYSSIIANITPSVPKVEIDEESTFAYQMQQQTNQIIEKANEQNTLLAEQNKRLAENYQRLEDLYKLKEKESEEARIAAKKAKRYNVVMLIVAIAAVLVAIAAWLLPNILG